jgi:hypothetical protein
MRATLVPAIAVSVSIAIAHAEPAAPDEPVPDPYPRALVQRELLQPAGMLEGTALLGIDVVGNDSTDQLATVTVHGRYQLRDTELAAGVSTQIYNNAPNTPSRDDRTLQAVFASVRHRIGTDLAAGVELAVGDPTSDVARYAPRLLLANKRRITPRAAVELGLATGIDRATLASGGDSARATLLAISGRIRAQAQLSRWIAVEGRAALGYFDVLGDPGLMSIPTELFAQDYGLRVVAGLTPCVDLVAGFDVLASGGTTTRVVSAGVTVRRVP